MNHKELLFLLTSVIRYITYCLLVRQAFIMALSHVAIADPPLCFSISKYQFESIITVTLENVN